MVISDIPFSLLSLQRNNPTVQCEPLIYHGGVYLVHWWPIILSLFPPSPMSYYPFFISSFTNEFGP
uniref:Uncharacterized protein n=1 Tax=Picea glauca TaxID=3330 RepID=A0A101M5A4_PICGL|nr:hypothetical protein ABT39_MTgene1226 [Picea glauca]